MKKYFFISIGFAVMMQFNGNIHAQSADLVVPPNFRIYSSSGVQQLEVNLYRNKQIPNLLFATANTVNFGTIQSIGYYISTNSGMNWTGNNMVNYNDGGDPAPIIDKNGVLIISHLAYTTGFLSSYYSTNLGNNWSANSTISAGISSLDLGASDDSPASIYYGRTYVVWSNFTVSQPPIFFALTTNSGINWLTGIQIDNPPSNHYSEGCDICCGSAGQVYVTWASHLNSSPYTEDFDGFALSTNGGTNWSTTENAFDANGIHGYLANKSSIRVNSSPRITVDKSGGLRNGWIYIIGCDKNLSPAGTDPDIIIHYSSNSGTSWSNAIRVNQDPVNNAATQWSPSICADDSGAVYVCYFDDRNVGGNQAQVYMSRSTNGGQSWTDIQISDHNFTPAPVPGLSGGYNGDRTALTYTSGKIIPLWNDISTGTYQIWSAIVTSANFTGIENPRHQIISSYTLYQNYPNPFNPSTEIKYSLPKKGLVKLVVFNALGQEIFTLVNENQIAGNYSVQFNGENLASGLYFYKIVVSGAEPQPIVYSQTRKMLLVK